MGRLMPVSLDNMTGGNLKTDSGWNPGDLHQISKVAERLAVISAVFKKQILPFIRNDYGCCFIYCHNNLCCKKHFMVLC